MTDQLEFITLTPTEMVPAVAANLIVLGHDSWDDWFEFETKYNVHYFDSHGRRLHLGSIKIGEAGQSTRRASLPRQFNQLPDNFFSVGLNEDYYKSLTDTGFSAQILKSLNDMAANLELFERFRGERVASISLFRTVDAERIRNKFHRLANGDAALTPYSFKYILDEQDSDEPGAVIHFDVAPNSSPPTNIHTIIGRNGVGKTTCLNGIAISYLDSLTTKISLSDNEKSRLRIYSEHSGGAFANLISVTFSAFDPFFTESMSTKGRYSYIGLKESLNKDQVRAIESANISFRVKAPDDLTKDFIESGLKCLTPSKKKRWTSALENLCSDPIFADSDIVELSEPYEDEDRWKDDASRVFKLLSSGHKIVLLTITRLVELVEEQSLVLLDEPESHLHPPLLSAFIRTLSELLTAQNGAAIIATHSPVVLQETPRSCAWILDRSGNTARARRPVGETFGENVGRLTHEVFGLEVTETGFYEMLRDAATRLGSYQAVIEEMDEQLGTEARAILYALVPSEKARVR